MDEELKAKWVAALRSGKYTQTKGTLRDDRGFCCLGVLLDVWGDCNGGWDGDVYRYETRDIEGEIELESELGKLSKLLLGDKEGEEGILIGMNDGDHLKGMVQQPFNVIADYIEANL